MGDCMKCCWYHGSNRCRTSLLLALAVGSQNKINSSGKYRLDGDLIILSLWKGAQALCGMLLKCCLGGLFAFS